jgi:hypothetical protein
MTYTTDAGVVSICRPYWIIGQKSTFCHFSFMGKKCPTCRIWGSHSGGYEKYHLLGCNSAYCVEIQPTFRRNISPLYSWSKNEPSKKSERKPSARLFSRIFWSLWKGSFQPQSRYSVENQKMQFEWLLPNHLTRFMCKLLSAYLIVSRSIQIRFIA